MPAYTPDAPVQTLNSGYPALVWDNEQLPLSGSGTDPGMSACSVAVSLKRNPHLPSCLSAEIQFSGDPGQQHEIRIQFADTNEDQYYVPRIDVPLYASELNPSYVMRIEVSNVVAKFARLKMYTMTNPVRVTARIF